MKTSMEKNALGKENANLNDKTNDINTNIEMDGVVNENESVTLVGTLERPVAETELKTVEKEPSVVKNAFEILMKEKNSK